ncbi:MAG: hypothetical protein Q4D62_12395 [Planctomycetia bacterium]|nr:hypothetical protein [Planctomycetia bacterium]
MQSFFNVVRKWMGGSEEERVFAANPPWHLKWVFCREKKDDETAESVQELECERLWIHPN